MCVIAIKPIGSINFDEATLHNCWQANDDGAGFAWYDEDVDMWRVEKGFMEWKKFWKKYDAMQFDEKDYVVCHFRIGTSGLKDGGNTHPFQITTDLEKMREVSGVYTGIAFHNGVVGRGEGNYSDSMLHIRDWLVPLYPHIDEPEMPRIIQELMCKGTSKWFITHGKKAYVLGTFVEHTNKQWKFSNTSYEKRDYTSYYGDSYGNGKWSTGSGSGTGKYTGGWYNGKFGYWVGASFIPYATGIFDKLTPGSEEWKAVWNANTHLQPAMLKYSREWEENKKMKNDFTDVDESKNVINNTVNWEKYKKRHDKKNGRKGRNTYLGATQENGAVVWAPKSQENMELAVSQFVICPLCYEDEYLFDFVSHVEVTAKKESKAVSEEERKAASNKTLCYACGALFDDFTGAVINKSFVQPHEHIQKKAETFKHGPMTAADRQAIIDMTSEDLLYSREM